MLMVLTIKHISKYSQLIVNLRHTIYLNIYIFSIEQDGNTVVVYDCAGNVKAMYNSKEVRYIDVKVGKSKVFNPAETSERIQSTVWHKKSNMPTRQIEISFGYLYREIKYKTRIKGSGFNGFDGWNVTLKLRYAFGRQRSYCSCGNERRNRINACFI